MSSTAGIVLSGSQALSSEQSALMNNDISQRLFNSIPWEEFIRDEVMRRRDVSSGIVLRYCY